MGKTHKVQKGSKGPTPQLRSRTTRSSKGRLLTETASSTTQLTTQLSLLGLYAARTIGDGNCLFRALSDQLYGTPSKHHELRQQICGHIASHKARYEPFVEDERGLDAHLKVMRENATYGGHMELSAFAHMTKRNVKVIQPGLVYVIEWSAGGWEEGSSVPPEPSTSDMAETSMTPRRSRRMSSKAGSPSKNKWKAEEEKKMKLGKGYYVYEEITSEEDSVKVEMEEKVTLENAGPTVYVAYHDWEHFSSIRNLNGPHTGYPNVVETPPPSTEDAVLPMTPRDREKEREKERKREREEKEKARKEKERQKRQKQRQEENENRASENSSLKVKLKLPSLSASANESAANLPSVVAPNSVSLSPSAAATTAKELLSHSRQQQDPSLIPLPYSRSVSPSPQYVEPSSSLVAPVLFDINNAIPLASSSVASTVYPEDPTVHAHRAYRHMQSLEPTQRGQYRSPKRSFDESSASGTEDGVEKRTRRKVVDSASHFVQGVGDDHGDKVRLSGVQCNALERERDGNRVGDVPDVVDIVMHVDVDGDGAETPALSAPGSSSSSPLSSLPSSAASSISDASSEADVDVDVESQADDIFEADGQGTSPHSHAIVPASPGLSKKAKQKYSHMHHPVGGVGTKSLTRRQRKALGLPKSKKPTTSLMDDGGLPGGSAGKIVIPGGKWKGRADQSQIMTPNAVLDVAGGGVEGEWTRNGTGRLDVRGFRELKI